VKLILVLLFSSAVRHSHYNSKCYYTAKNYFGVSQGSLVWRHYSDEVSEFIIFRCEMSWGFCTPNIIEICSFFADLAKKFWCILLKFRTVADTILFFGRNASLEQFCNKNLKWLIMRIVGRYEIRQNRTEILNQSIVKSLPKCRHNHCNYITFLTHWYIYSVKCNTKYIHKFSLQISKFF